MLDKKVNSYESTFVVFCSLVYVFLGFALPICVPAQELLKNGDFEEVLENKPKHWNIFLQPNDGNYAKIDFTTAIKGSKSVVISHLKPYKIDPLNNWNQRIDVHEKLKKISFTGFIKTKEATKAYFLIQFWNKNGKILQSAKSEEIKDTNDWMCTTIDSDIPENTDFIMVRCVLEGVGTAWFDNLSMTGEIHDRLDIPLKDLDILQEKLDKLEKEINNIRGEYIYLRNRLDELEKRFYNYVEKVKSTEQSSELTNSTKIKDNLPILPRGITIEDIQK